MTTVSDMQYLHGITLDTKQHSMLPNNKMPDFVIVITTFNGYRATLGIFIQGEYFLLDIPVPVYCIGYGILSNKIEIIFQFNCD